MVGLLVDEVLERRSVRLTDQGDGIAEPAQLRRRDDSSVYTVHGADHYTSAAVLAAEQRLLAAAGRLDGATVDTPAVDLALLESAANGVTLNAGQAALVRGMATSGARLQLAIAPAGAGKTTALRALATAWANGGGHVIGLAPSAAAAAVLRDQISTPTPAPPPRRMRRRPQHRQHHGTVGRLAQASAVTDTLAKLTWSIAHGDLPDWAAGIDAATLVLIDEAGMADTLTLDTVVQFVTARGGSVRLIGDDQQLAAIGAGGVLRDIAHTHGALRLTELMRFTDPAEAAATLALRDGAPEALGFYLDQHRVHVGDPATTTEDVFTAWQTDVAHGLDAIMLAPTRELVAQLNQRARAHRLDSQQPGTLPGSEVALADGNAASVGDLVITRSNDRRLQVDRVGLGQERRPLDRPATSATTAGCGSSTPATGTPSTLPAGYVTASTELGYATTVHAAQGVSADTMHGLVSGQESRQQLYTMLTRGRVANHVYVQVVGDGDPHTAIHPDTLAPPTATDILESDPGPGPLPRLRDHPAPRRRRPRPAARPGDRPLHRRPPLRRRRPPRPRHRPPPRTRRRPRRPRTDRPACLAHPPRAPDPARRPRPRPPHRAAHRRLHPRARHRRRPRRRHRLAPRRPHPATTRPAQRRQRHRQPGRSPGSPASPRPWHSTRRGANTSPAEPNSSPPSPPRSRTQPTHGRPRGSPTPPPAPTPPSSPTCRSGGPPLRSPTRTCAPPGPPAAEGGSPLAAPTHHRSCTAPAPPPCRNGKSSCTPPPPGSATTTSPRPWPNGSPPSPAPGSTPAACSDAPPPSGRSPMTTPPPPSGGA